MDDTLITNNKWVDFNTYLGVSKEDDERLYRAFVSNEISYADWLSKLTRLYDLPNKKITKRQIVAVLQKVQIKRGAFALINALHAKGYDCAIITGSFAITAHSLAETFRIKHVLANTRCVFDEDQILTGIHSKGTEATMKNEYLITLCKTLSIDPRTDCYVIGDSVYDLPMFQTTGKGVTFTNAPAQLKKHALHVVNDFPELKLLFEKRFII